MYFVQKLIVHVEPLLSCWFYILCYGFFMFLLHEYKLYFMVFLVILLATTITTICIVALHLSSSKLLSVYILSIYSQCFYTLNIYSYSTLGNAPHVYYMYGTCGIYVWCFQMYYTRKSQHVIHV